MAISKKRKEDLIAEYTEQITQSKGIVLAEYHGLTIGRINQIRHQLCSLGGKFQVVKNSLLKIALKNANVPLPESWLIGPIAVSFCFEEVPPVIKVLMTVVKEMENQPGSLEFRGGVLGPSVIKAEDMRAVADLPSRDVLLAQELGTINAPASQVTGVVASGIRQVLNVLQAYVDKLDEVGCVRIDQ